MIFLLSIVVLDWVIRFAFITALVPASLLLARWGSLKPAYRWFLGILVCRLLSIMISEQLYRHNINPNYGGSVYYIIVVVFYAGFFFSVTDFKKYKKILFAVVLVHMVFATINLLFIQRETINTYSSISLSLIQITFCLLFFYRLLKHLPTENLLTMPSFCFVTAEFAVTVGQMLMESFAHFLINIFNDNLVTLWVFHHGLGVAGNLIIAYAAWLVFSDRRPVHSR